MSVSMVFVRLPYSFPDNQSSFHAHTQRRYEVPLCVIRPSANVGCSCLNSESQRSINCKLENKRENFARSHKTMSQTGISIERFVPEGNASLAEDAPGWGSNAKNDSVASESTSDNNRAADPKSSDNDLPPQPLGPNCWKCRGTGQKLYKGGEPVKKKVTCPVCQGNGRLPAKKTVVEAATRPGRICRAKRQPPLGWQPAKPLAYALQEGNVLPKWKDMVVAADNGQDGILDSSHDNASTDHDKTKPSWLPGMGEELVKLNGTWRILQRVGGHRWTTDDCVTAYVAVRESMQYFRSIHNKQSIRYLDLGTGNGSVLQMVLRAMLQQDFVFEDSKGIEARTEAVGLARRSLMFNVGPDFPVQIIHGDFRSVVQGDDPSLRNFDLITGTPPYFRVDFSVKNGEKVTSAVIRQGGMPTALQSAPARCEFRGGIEAYCEAAARALVPETGRFVVCENFLNHDRVLKAAQDNGLRVLRVVKVHGRQGKDCLFCVYVMFKMISNGELSSPEYSTEEEKMFVRDIHGNWTKSYTETVFRIMAIPPFDDSSN